MSEADTCRKYVVPKLYNAGWDNDHIAEQLSITGPFTQYGNVLEIANLFGGVEALKNAVNELKSLPYTQ